jgi:hypothetical protein
MKYINILIWCAALGVASNVAALDVFPTFEKYQILYAIPTNTPGCLSDPKYLVGTNLIYKLNGQIFSNPIEGHIQTIAEGFSGNTDETSPWKTLTEVLAAYQHGSPENETRAFYDDTSTNFLKMVYGNDQMKARYQTMTGSITGMQAVMGFDYSGAYLAEVKLEYKNGSHVVMPYYFVLNANSYKLCAFQDTNTSPMFTNIGLYLNK